MFQKPKVINNPQTKAIQKNNNKNSTGSFDYHPENNEEKSEKFLLEKFCVYLPTSLHPLLPPVASLMLVFGGMER
jgi:hypothetical protein